MGLDGIERVVNKFKKGGKLQQPHAHKRGESVDEVAVDE